MPSQMDDVVGFIPYLRRHARLLTGTKEVGDEYVRLCLELLVEEPERLEGGDLRIQLFKAFHTVWSVINAPAHDDAAQDATTLEGRLEDGIAALPATERRVLLLIAVEDFSYEAVAEILALDVETVRRLFTLARRALDEQVARPVLIIEDEPLIAMELSHIVQDMGFTVAGIAARQRDALATAKQERPGLVLADIQLQDDGSGIEAAQSILQAFEVPIVFVTGFPERLLTGEGLEPAFVVAKPYKIDGLKATIAQALAAYAKPETATEHKTKLLAKLRHITGSDVTARSSRLA